MYKISCQHATVSYVTRKGAWAAFEGALWPCVLLDRKGRIVAHT